MKGLIVGTAGHIDHGKTSMVRCLTGIDLDSLPEEQERGITIALGFTWLDLPDGRRAAFVDVPGHERLVRTMVAGATGIDAVLLCVSAVDGVMPQTREHLAILSLLGVERGAVVLTMADLVDPEMLELAQEDVADAVVGTFLEGAPILPFSAITGEGKDAVIERVAGFPDTERAPDGPFRLPVDRAFIRPGFGTVVTGTSWSGQLKDGETVQLLPGEGTARVRGIQVHGESADTAIAGRRTALNLAGIEVDDVPRGTVVSHGDVPCPSMIDVRYEHLAGAPKLEDGVAVRVLLGTTECMGRLHLAADAEELLPGRVRYAQIRLEQPMPCLPGDRFVVRRSSPIETLGGGIVLDPWAQRMRRKNRLAWGKQLERLDKGDRGVWLERAGEVGLDPKEWARRSDGDEGIQLGDRMFARTVVGRLEGALLEALTQFHSEQPLALGANRRELRRGRLGHLTDRVFDALVDRLADLSTVEISGPMLRATGFQVALNEFQAGLKSALEDTIGRAGAGGILPKVLHAAHPEPEVAALLRLVESEGTAKQVTGLGWVANTSLQRLRDQLKQYFATEERLAPAAFKEMTGLSRKGAIPLLEHLDATKWTRRSGDDRVAGPNL